jgi:hypothetical protein
MAEGEADMSTDENKKPVRRFYREIDEGNPEAMDELVAEHSAAPRNDLEAGGCARDALNGAFEPVLDVPWKCPTRSLTR